MQCSPAYSLYHCGDHAFTADLGEQIDVETNRSVIRLFDHIQQAKHPSILDIIPAYSSLTIVYDPLYFVTPNSHPETFFRTIFDAAIQQITKKKDPEPASVIRIPVCYHPSLAPDLETLCHQHKIDVDSFIKIHTQQSYRVFMNGFLPGFAYMGTVDDRIATARHAAPRKKVAAGSVGIAGHQTGIYPFESPGGWQLIGRTTVSLFNPDTDNPCLLKPGDEVQFYSIPLENFHS